MAAGKCMCGKWREKPWHLVCPACWGTLPQNLRDEVWTLYQVDRGSGPHLAAIRECVKWLMANAALTGGEAVPSNGVVGHSES